MADLDQLTLPNADTERSAAAELRKDQLADRKQQAQQAKAGAKRGGPMGPVTSEVEREMNQLALTAWTQAWQKGHELVEGVAFAFVGLGSIIAGGPAILLYLIRLVGGNLMGGVAPISPPVPPAPGPMGAVMKNVRVSVPLIPPFAVGEGIYRTSKILLITVMTCLLWSVIILALFVITHPYDVAWLATQAFFEQLIAFGKRLINLIIPGG